MLAEAFAVLCSDQLASRGAPAVAAFEIFVHSVLAEEPISLAGVAGEGLAFEVVDGGDIDNELGIERVAVEVDAADGIDIEEVGDFVRGEGWILLLGLVIGGRGVEAGVADEAAGHFVVAHIIDRRCSEDDVGADFADDFGDPPTAVVVDDDLEVEEFEADVVGSEGLCALAAFLSTDAGDFEGTVLGTTAISGGHGGNCDRTTELLEER